MFTWRKDMAGMSADCDWATVTTRQTFSDGVSFGLD